MAPGPAQPTGGYRHAAGALVNARESRTLVQGRRKLRLGCARREIPAEKGPATVKRVGSTQTLQERSIKRDKSSGGGKSERTRDERSFVWTQKLESGFLRNFQKI